MKRSRAAGAHYIVMHAPSPGFSVHLAVPKKVFPRAVDRNREKRLCRAIFRELRVTEGTWNVRVARTTTGTPFAGLREELRGIVERLG